MNLLIEDFTKMYGQDTLDEIVDRAGIHSSAMDNPAPIRVAERLVFGLLEILDFQCCQYGDFDTLSEEEIKSFLIDHKEEVMKMEIGPPSFIGLLVGVFDFLKEDA